MTHALNRILHGKDAVIGAIVGIDSALSAEAMAKAGYDYLFLDQQHGAIDNATLLSQIQAVQGSGRAALVRPSWNEPAGIMRALDFGADGIIAPLINTAEDAEALVSAMRYPPEGQRSWGPIRAGVPDWDAYGARANGQHSAIAMIETAAGYENLDAILAVPGLDGILIGPFDLAFSLGLHGQPIVGESALAAIIRDIRARAAAAEVLPGTHAGDAATARALVAQGFRFVSIGFDAAMLFDAARATLHAFDGR